MRSFVTAPYRGASGEGICLVRKKKVKVPALKLSYYTLSESVSKRGVQVAKLCMSYVNFKLCEGKGNIVKSGHPTEVWK